jgi:hypothetical protein
MLNHLTDDPDELLAGTGADRRVVAVRVRAIVGQAGGSAHARWRRALATEWATWTRTLPWRVATTLSIAAAAPSALPGRLGSVVVVECRVDGTCQRCG